MLVSIASFVTSGLATGRTDGLGTGSMLGCMHKAGPDCLGGWFIAGFQPRKLELRPFELAYSWVSHQGLAYDAFRGWILAGFCRKCWL
jgi:hypothetical protein